MTDSRDERGKRHELAFVILLFSWALLRSTGKLSLSFIHRTMFHFHNEIANECGSSSKRCISRPQLSRVLNSFDYKSFNDFSKDLCCSSFEDVWYALDGKELRGSIDGVAGEKRGENIVLKVGHTTKKSTVIGYYSGKKESEKTSIKNFFKDCENLKDQKYTLDALHNSEQLLSDIHQKSGTYLVQIKNNQKILLEDLKDISMFSTPFQIHTTEEKGHGRIEERKYEAYSIDPTDICHKWKCSGIQTLIKVNRQTTQLKNQRETKEISYYVTNQNSDIEELSNAIRGHWSVETNNYIRDTNFGEDGFKSFKIKIQRSVSAILTFIMNVVNALEMEGNTNEKRENLAYSKETAKFALKNVL